MAVSFRKRSDFSNDDIYAVYVRDNIAIGQTVLCSRTYEEVKVGDSGRVMRLDKGDLHELNVQVDWQHKGDKYWVSFMHVEIVGVLDVKKIKVGDWVKVKSTVDKPKYGWGDINRRSIGIVTALNPTIDAVTVDYPQQNAWKGLLSELETVVQTHPGIMCCGCQDLPLHGSRFKCAECSQFDLCQTCFINKNVHRHSFARIVCPGSHAVQAGKPEEITVVGDKVRVRPEVDKPKYGWGKVTKTSVGQLKAISPNGRDVTIDFDQQASWQCILSEICKITTEKPVTGKQVSAERTKQERCAPVQQQAATVKCQKQSESTAKATAWQSDDSSDSDEESDEQGQRKDLLWWFTKALQEAVEESAATPRTPRATAPKQFFPPTNAISGKQECSFQGVCKRLKNCLGLSDKYFDQSYDTCFCSNCHGRRGDQPYYRRGVPTSIYGVPIGWYKFGLRTPAKADSLDVFKMWHVAFHGTRHDCVKSILDTGDLLMPGDLPPEGDELRPPDNHYDPSNPDMKPPPGHDVNKIYLSPSIRYAGCNVYSRPAKYEDSTTSKAYIARVAFQVRIKPGSYDVGDQTVGLKTQLDPQIPNSQLEWATKRRGVTILTGLLVKIEELGSAGVRQPMRRGCEQQ